MATYNIHQAQSEALPQYVLIIPSVMRGSGVHLSHVFMYATAIFEGAKALARVDREQKATDVG